MKTDLKLEKSMFMYCDNAGLCFEELRNLLFSFFHLGLEFAVCPFTCLTGGEECDDRAKSYINNIIHFSHKFHDVTFFFWTPFACRQQTWRLLI